MANSKSLVPNRSKRAAIVVPLVFLIGAAAIQLVSPAGSCAVCRPSSQTWEDSNVELTRARLLADSTKSMYETVKRLSETGSVSQRVLRRSDMQRKVALLDYSSLLNPSRREKNLVLKSEVILQYRSKELAIIQKLYRLGSVSKVAYLRSVAARDIAASAFKAARSASQTQRKMQAINAAKSNFEMAQKEFEIADRLFLSRAISRTALDRALVNLKIATAELEASKQSLGARAVQVKQ